MDFPVDSFSIDVLNRTALHKATTFLIVEELIQNGADIFARDNIQNTPLHYPKCEKSVGLLLQTCINKKQDVYEYVNLKNDMGNTPLFYCEDPNSIKVLITYGADVDIKNNHGNTPLHYHRNSEIIKELLNFGADVFIQNDIGDIPLHYQYIEESVKLIIESVPEEKRSFLVNIKDEKGETPLHKREDVKIVKILIDVGAEIDAKDNDGFTPLHHPKDPMAVEEILKKVHDKKEFVNSRTTSGENTLHLQTNSLSIKLLIDAGADVNVQNEYNMTPLHCENKDIDAIELLIKAGANVYLKDDFRERMPIEDDVIRGVYQKFLLEKLIRKRKLWRFVRLMTSEKGIKYFWNPENLGGKWAKKSLSNMF